MRAHCTVCVCALSGAHTQPCTCVGRTHAIEHSVLANGCVCGHIAAMPWLVCTHACSQGRWHAAQHMNERRMVLLLAWQPVTGVRGALWCCCLVAVARAEGCPIACGCARRDRGCDCVARLLLCARACACVCLCDTQCARGTSTGSRPVSAAFHTCAQCVALYCIAVVCSRCCCSGACSAFACQQWVQLQRMPQWRSLSG